MNVQVPKFPSCCRLAWLAAHSWHTYAPSPWVVRAVAMGYCLQFRVKLFCFCRMIKTAVCKEAVVILKEEISALLQKRAIQVVLNTETAFKCSWPGRLIDRSIDLRCAIFHVAIHPNHKHFLRFAFEGVAYEYPVLLFGLSLALCKCAEAPLAPFINKGLSILAYLDDWALVACYKKQAANTAITQLGIWFLFSCYCSCFSLQRGGKKRRQTTHPKYSPFHMRISINLLNEETW